MIERVVAPGDVLKREFRARVELYARNAVTARGTCSLVVPGGSVAAALLPVLVDADMPWESVDVFWCDERVVPADSQDSNWALAWQEWLRHLSFAAGPRVHRMPVDIEPSERAAEVHERDVNTAIHACGGALDVALLGLGPDGHVASLFPGHPAFASHQERAVVAVHHAPKPPAERLTLTLPVLADARLVILAAFGVEKAGIVREVLEHESSETPAAALLRRRHNPSLVLLDLEAASLLESRR